MSSLSAKALVDDALDAISRKDQGELVAVCAVLIERIGRGGRSSGRARRALQEIVGALTSGQPVRRNPSATVAAPGMIEVAFDHRGRDATEFIRSAIAEARDRVAVTSYGFQPRLSTPLASLLIEKVREGVSVRLIVGGRHRRGFVDESALSLLEAAGVEVFEIDSFHAKVAIIDGERVLAGSANAVDKSSDVVVRIDSHVLASLLESWLHAVIHGEPA